MSSQTQQTNTLTNTSTAKEDKTKNNNNNLFCAMGSESETSLSFLSDKVIRQQLYSFLDQMGDRDDVLLIPPDYTRIHSQAGKITRMICQYYNFIPTTTTTTSTATSTTTSSSSSSDNANANNEYVPKTSRSTPTVQILPALGTHAPMTQKEIEIMYGTELAELNKKQQQETTSSSRPCFLVHDWRKDVVTIGHAPAEMVATATRGMIREPWPAQSKRLGKTTL